MRAQRRGQARTTTSVAIVLDRSGVGVNKERAANARVARRGLPELKTSVRVRLEERVKHPEARTKVGRTTVIFVPAGRVDACAG